MRTVEIYARHLQSDDRRGQVGREGVGNGQWLGDLNAVKELQLTVCVDLNVGCLEAFTSTSTELPTPPV